VKKHFVKEFKLTPREY